MKDLRYLRKLEAEPLYSIEEVQAIEEAKKNRTAEDILKLHFEGKWRFGG